MDIYEPAEDSYLLQKYVQTHANGKVLDIGTGSGIQAFTAAKNPHVTSVRAIDIKQTAIIAIRKEIKKEKKEKIKAKKSNLFQNVPKIQFNTIIFNPPYLPQDPGIEDPALYGGKKGYELSECFFQEVSNHLQPDGQILFLFSTLTNKSKIEQILTQNLLSWQELGCEKIPFETLYVYKISKSSLRQKIESHRISHLLYYNKGKRGLVYKGTLQTGTSKRTVAIKINQPHSPSRRLDLECHVLQEINKVSIGPTLYAGSSEYIIMEFIVGVPFPLWLPQANPSAVRKVIHNLLRQCYQLDRQMYTKEEMHHPFKHILITTKNKPILIDFERCTKTNSPKNLTQFTEYLCRIAPTLLDKGITLSIPNIRAQAKEYKDTPSLVNYKKLSALML